MSDAAAEIRGTAVRIRRLPSELQKVERNAGRRAARKLREAAIDRFTATSIGRAIYRKDYAVGEKAARTRQLRAVFPMPRVESPAEGQLRISYTLKGIPALVHQGGRTRPHEIKATGGGRIGSGPRPVLAFKVQGAQRFATRVQHPGSRFDRNAFFDAAGADALQVLQLELERGYEQAAGKV